MREAALGFIGIRIWHVPFAATLCIVLCIFIMRIVLCIVLRIILIVLCIILITPCIVLCIILITPCIVLCIMLYTLMCIILTIPLRIVLCMEPHEFDSRRLTLINISRFIQRNLFQILDFTFYIHST